MTKTVETIRYMQTRTMKAPAFCQAVLKEAGITAKSVKSLSQLVKKLGDAEAIRISEIVFANNSRAHTHFRNR